MKISKGSRGEMLDILNQVQEKRLNIPSLFQEERLNMSKQVQAGRCAISWLYVCTAEVEWWLGVARMTSKNIPNQRKRMKISKR